MIRLRLRHLLSFADSINIVLMPAPTGRSKIAAGKDHASQYHLSRVSCSVVVVREGRVLDGINVGVNE